MLVFLLFWKRSKLMESVEVCNQMVLMQRGKCFEVLFFVLFCIVWMNFVQFEWIWIKLSRIYQSFQKQSKSMDNRHNLVKLSNSSNLLLTQCPLQNFLVNLLYRFHFRLKRNIFRNSTFSKRFLIHANGFLTQLWTWNFWFLLKAFFSLAIKGSHFYDFSRCHKRIS